MQGWQKFERLKMLVEEDYYKKGFLFLNFVEKKKN